MTLYCPLSLSGYFSFIASPFVYLGLLALYLN